MIMKNSLLLGFLLSFASFVTLLWSKIFFRAEKIIFYAEKIYFYALEIKLPGLEIIC
jgi:hypothetical protein